MSKYYFTITIISSFDGICNIFNKKSKKYLKKINCYDKIIVDSATNVTAAEVYSKGGNDEIICNQKPRVISSGSGDDKVVFSCRTNGGGYTSTIFDEEGNDHYIFSGAERSNYTVQGGAGINVFEINSDSQYITFDTAKTNAHKNTFYIKGDFNNVSCSNSTVENLVVMLGNSNRFSGTARYYVNGAGTTGNRISGPMAPNYGTLVGGASRPVIIGGASFQFSANSSSSIAAADRKLTYFFNPFNNSIEIIGEGYQVTNNNTYGFGDHDLILQGNEMIFISMISKYNSFTLEDGENNIIQFIGNSEDNKIKIKSDNNQIHVSQGIINANLELTGSNNIFNLTHTAFFKTANVYGESNTFNLNSQRGSTINLYGDRNTVTDAATTVAQNASHTVIINSSYNTVDLRPGANQFNPPCDYCSINGNFNNVSISRNKGDLNVIGNNNVVKNGVLTASNGAADMSYAINLEGNNNIVEAELAANLNFNGSNNTFTSYGDLLNLGINGNENSIELKGLAIRSSTNSNIIGNTNTLIDNYGNNITNIVGNNNTLTGGIDVDVYKVKGDGNNLTGGDNDDAFIINSGLGNTINGNNSASANIMINNGKNTNYSNVKDCTLNGFGLDVKVGIGSADSAIIHEEISLNTLGIDVDLSNQESARASLEKIDEMINSLSEQILSIGASINRLEMVLEEQSIKLDNMISSRSTLQDADIAEVSSNFIKSQILQQSSVTLMASTKNLRQGSILGLLQRL